MKDRVHKILILGASGMLGHQLWRSLNAWASGSNYQIYGTVRKSKEHYKCLHLPEIEKLVDNFDVGDFNKIKDLLDNLQPTLVINCIGLTLRKKDLADIEKCYHINSMLPKFVGQWCEIHSSKLIHFSTDCVFDGKKGDSYSESDLPSAFDHYGQSKYLGEVSSGGNLTLRLSIVGRELENKSELIEWVFSQKNKMINGFSSVVYSGITTNYVARELIRIIENFPMLTGLYQVSSEPITKYEILAKLNDKFKLNLNIVKNDNYVTNKSLNSQKYQNATGFKSPSWEEMIDDLFSDREFYERLN